MTDADPAPGGLFYIKWVQLPLYAKGPIRPKNLEAQDWEHEPSCRVRGFAAQDDQTLDGKPHLKVVESPMQSETRGSSNSLWLYFGLAFGVTWLIWSPGILDALGWIELPCPFIVFFFLGTWGPFIGASIEISREGGWESVKAFWKRGLDFRLSINWMGLMVALCAFVSALPLGLYLLRGGFSPEAELLKQPWMILPVFLTYFFTGGANEEWGWRGFALDRLQNRWGPLRASILLGVIWGLWHLPLFFIPSTG